MRQRFEEPTHQTPNTDMGQRFNAPEVRATTRTKSGNINFGLVAIFGLPLLIIAGLLQSSKKYVDVFDGAEALEAKLAVAKKQGFPFEAKDLAKASEGKTNSAPLVKRYFLDSDRPIANEYRKLFDTGAPATTELKAGVKTIVGYAKEIAACETFDPHYDFDESFGLLLPEYAQLKLAVRVLTYDAREAANADNAVRALESLADARRICAQLSDERPLIGMLVAVSCQAIYYRVAADIGVKFSDRPDVLQKLNQMLDQDIPVPEMEKGLQADYYSALAYLRNLERSGGVVGAFSTGSNGYFEPKKDIPLVRGGLPKSVVAQGLLLKSLEHFQKLVEIVRTEKDPVKAGAKMDDYSRSMDRTLANLFSEIVMPVFSQALISRDKPETNRAIAEWAIEIESKYHGQYPKSLPNRLDPGLGGQLIYRPLGDQFLIYSTSTNRADDGGPRSYKGKPNDFTDDYGQVFPLKIDPKSTQKLQLFEGPGE